MPRVGQPLAPAPSDIAEVLATSAPLDSTVAFDPSMEAGYTSGNQMTGDVRPTSVQLIQKSKITLYNYLGADRSVTVEGLGDLINMELPADRRLHLRCPLCVHLPNGGLHAFSGPNACPGKPQQQFMACPICKSRGISKRVYDEGIGIVEALADDSDDENFIEADLPNMSTAKDRLRTRLAEHMTAFHSTEAQQLYDVRREVNGNGFRIIWGRS